MNVFDKHQIKIAKDTLRLSNAGALVLGGMTKEEARDVLQYKAKWSAEQVRKWEQTN